MGISRNASPIALFLILALLLAATRPSAHGQSQAAAQQPQGSFLGVDGSKIYYEQCGTGPEAVVLIHDGIAHSVVWDGVWPAFCKQFHTIRYDRRGYGRSPVTTQPYFETDDLQALLRHLLIKHAMLVGSSHGGALAINFTLEHPTLVEQLVLAGAVVDGYRFSDHFLMRTIKNEAPMQKNDVLGLITNWINDKYVIAANHAEAR